MANDKFSVENGEPVWNLKFSKYHRDNLLLMINMCGYPHGNPHTIEKLRAMDSGDWIGEIAIMLGDPSGVPGKEDIVSEEDETNLNSAEVRKEFET